MKAQHGTGKSAQGNLAFKRAALLRLARSFSTLQDSPCSACLRRTTAASQYLSEAKSYYIEALGWHWGCSLHRRWLAICTCAHTHIYATRSVCDHSRTGMRHAAS